MRPQHPVRAVRVAVRVAGIDRERLAVLLVRIEAPVALPPLQEVGPADVRQKISLVRPAAARNAPVEHGIQRTDEIRKRFAGLGVHPEVLEPLHRQPLLGLAQPSTLVAKLAGELRQLTAGLGHLERALHARPCALVVPRLLLQPGRALEFPDLTRALTAVRHELDHLLQRDDEGDAGGGPAHPLHQPRLIVFFGFGALAGPATLAFFAHAVCSPGA